MSGFVSRIILAHKELISEIYIIGDSNSYCTHKYQINLKMTLWKMQSEIILNNSEGPANKEIVACVD